MEKVPGKLRWCTFEKECFISQSDLQELFESLIDKDDLETQNIINNMILTLRSIRRDWVKTLNKKQYAFFKKQSRLN